ncbi:MAG: gliding motility-associated C-terminal domain-containing protein, partial [Crocinitomicaceae bacterium]
IDNGVTWSNSSAYTGLPAGIYEVISRDIIGCTFATTVTLTDPDVITISTVGDTTVCENGIATLIATSTNGSAFNWSHTNSVVSNQTLFPSTDSTITVHATNIVGCSSDTITINLSMYDPITISITGNDSICPGDPTSVEVFPNGGLDGYDYTWTANGSGANYVTSQFSANPTAQVQYCATVVDGCESTPKSLCTNIIMRDVPTTTFTSKVIEKCDPAEIEIEVTTPDYLFATAVVGTENTNYSVVNASPDPSTVTHTYSSAGDFDVYLKVISQYGCESDTFAFNEFTAFPVPEPNFIINPEEASIFLPFFDLTNTTRTPDLSYIWQMPGGEPQVSTQENTSVSYPEGEPGVYPIQLIAISDQGCRDTITRTAVVLNDIVVYSPNSFTPDGDDHNEFWRVYIKGINIYDYHLQIYNRWGEVVFESFDPEATWDGTFANGDHLEPGTFVWFIQTKDAVTDKVHEFRGTVNLFR